MKNEDRGITTNIVDSEKYFDRIVQKDFADDNNRKSRKYPKNLKIKLAFYFIYLIKLFI